MEKRPYSSLLSQFCNSTSEIFSTIQRKGVPLTFLINPTSIHQVHVTAISTKIDVLRKAVSKICALSSPYKPKKMEHTHVPTHFQLSINPKGENMYTYTEVFTLEQ